MQARLDNYCKNNLIRHESLVIARDQNTIEIEGIKYLNFASNDYLGLTMHPKVVAAFIQGAKEFGFGSGSATAITGYYSVQRTLEEKFAEYLQRERTILFNSGYHANIGVLSTLANREHTIVADKLCHASIIDGIRLSSAKYYRYHHSDIQHAESLLSKAKNPILITESVFSMEGNIVAVDQLSEIAEKYSAQFLVDDAHALGVLGLSGRGSQEYFNLTEDAIDCLLSPLGKACGGMGCIVSGRAELIDGLKQFARTYRYTTALPPAVISGLLAALEIMIVETWRRERLYKVINYFITQANARHLKLISNDLTPIKSIYIGSNARVLHVQAQLKRYKITVGCVRPPTVPKGTARLRISLNCHHQEHQIDELLDIVAETLQHASSE
jgi:8-amino-7-oxononanoate synthase